MIKTGFAREVITPVRGIPLIGYFNPRPNKGILDDLYVKTILFQHGRTICGIVSFDLCFVSDKMLLDIRKGLDKKDIKFSKNLIVCATHTHTGPFTSDFFGGKMDKGYYSILIEKAIMSVKEAYASLYASEISYGSVKNNPFAFNRRYYMKDGKVVTNPGKLNPDIVKPEGVVDDEIGFITIKQDGRITSLITNIVNHTDTIGRDLVSADWPGQMEKEIQKQIGYDVDVITLIGCSGNINHFDVSNNNNQTCYDEAKKIGKGYAGIILDNLKNAKEVSPDCLEIDFSRITVPYRVIDKKDLAKAREIVKTFKFDVNKDLTSEDLAKGAGAVKYVFARELISFCKNCSGKTRDFDITAIKFGKDLALSSLPAEPFTEIGMEIKKRSPFKKTFIICLGQGECGYVPLTECFNRGGYEILPVKDCGADENTANLFINNTFKILTK